MIKLDACTGMWQSTHPDTIFSFNVPYSPQIFWSMAFQAAGRKCRSITLSLMGVVTTGADKSCRRLITPAHPQKRT